MTGARTRQGITCGARIGVLALATALAVAVGACGGEDESASSPSAPPAATESEPSAGPAASDEPARTDAASNGAAAGGVYRVGVESSFNFTGGFDPTGEYLSIAFGLYSNLLVRTLVSYKHVAGPAGAELVPDLATDLGQVSDDGLTYTFTLKDGIRFGPPVSREITSRDVEFAFERIATPALVAQYGFYYGIVAGMAEFGEGKADDIKGIETPDDKTVVFHLVQPAGDFLYRLAMPAAGPIPEEVAGCFSEAGEYGRYLVTSGPYMVEGANAQDASSCDTLAPLAGFEPDAHLMLVRNPDYDPATDTPEARENLPDRFEFLINSNNDDIYNKIRAGELEGEIASPSGRVIREYRSDRELESRIHSNPSDGIWYLTMNLTQPPFDDIHVRKAVNFVVDKTALQRVWGGSVSQGIAHHIVPDSMLNGLLADYDPYPSQGDAGDLEAAKAEMRQSRYDTDSDGLCDAPVCDDVVHVAATQQVIVDMTPILEDALARIGIQLETRTLENAYTVIQTVARNVPFSSISGWGKDYPDASTYMVLFDSRSIIPSGNVNYSLVGLTPNQAQGLEGLQGTTRGVPSVDADIDACTVLSGDERTQCWADLDRQLMEEIVPWVPYGAENEVDVIGTAVTRYEFDQFSGETAYAHVAVDTSKQ